ncbi:DEKNAAC104994 [Brettanomyces naardenensis]|uniref:DEKNAAC104994 n=1 Tax=Brettanomyces naardenensis TaxID=13370 RepID=A0A448YRZ5_BRENA|nr:DEKNAAC104994 [Brettanomyces naardenensis]
MVVLANKLIPFTQKRGVALFGNLGQSVGKIIPKDHVYFQVKKPIGFKERPRHLADTEKERKQQLTVNKVSIPKKIWNFYFDGITRKTRVRKIQKEMAYGGMYDFHVYNKTKGRLFAAPPSYFRREKSLFFPNFAVKTLSDDNSELIDVLSNAKVTILRVFSTQTGSHMTEDYFRIPNAEDTYLSESGMEQFHQSYPDAQIVQMILSETWAKYLMHTQLSARKLKKTIPESQYDNFLFAMREDALERDSREKLLMTNLYAGYVYVIDDSFKIRWIGSGWPEKNEVESLWKSVRGVSKEVKF